MYKVLIVDDEVMIRNGLYNMIPWKKLEIGDVRTASCAQEALELARETKPDIVLTDICMPEMDGLEMTRLMLEFLPDLKVLVLTGYDDFKYAQKSCYLGVKEFILKPVDEVSLANSIKLQVENIKNELQSSLKCNILNRKRVLENQRAFEKSLMQLTEKSNETEEMDIDDLALEENCRYQVGLISPVLSGDSVWVQHKNLLLISIKTILIDMIDSNNSGWTFQNRDGDIVVIFYIKNNNDSAEDQISRLQEIVNVEYDVDLETGIGPIVANISKIKTSYKKAKENVKANKAEFDLQEDSQGIEGSRQKDKLSYYRNQMLESIPDTEAVKKYLKLYIDEVKNSGMKKVNAEQKFYELASAFYWEYLKTTGYQADGRLETLITTLQSNDLENCCVFIEMFIAKLMYTNKKQMHEIVEAAAKYIKDNLTEDLTVFTLAEQFHVARNYFSRLFKKEMGEGCNEYITRLRIEKAKQLLGASRLKTYEIAEKVGYHDTNYFSLAFKKNTGLSPKEFREKLNNPE